MNSKARRRKPALPEFAPLDKLAPGQAMNPYRLFKARSVREKILTFPKLAPGAKLVWFMLADQVYLKGYSWHSERELARLVALSRRQFGRHLRKLRKLRLVHSEPDIGSANRTWLLFHSLFAFCSHLPPRTNDVGVPADMAQESPHMWRSNNRVLRILEGTGHAPGAVGTSYRGSSGDSGEGEAKPNGQAKTEANLPITDRSVTPKISRDARAFWYSLTTAEKRNRSERAARLAESLEHYRQYLADRDPNISRQARHEVARHSDELRALGFYIPGTEERKHP